MIHIIHGEDIVNSRQHLRRIIAQQRQTDQLEVVRLDGLTLEPDQLTQSLQSSSLFGKHRLVVIENLFSQPKTSLKNQLLKLLHAGIKSNLILWEKKSISTGFFKKLVNHEPKVKLFKTPVLIFKLLDALRPDNQKQLLMLYHQALNQNPAEAIFYFLCRRVAQLIQAADTQSSFTQKAPWQQARLNRQAKHLPLESWLKLHQKLVQLDYEIKTGQNLLPLTSQLDLLFLDI